MRTGLDPEWWCVFGFLFCNTSCFKMDEDTDHKLPNLKICIENTESDDERRDRVAVSEDEELDYNEEVESSGSSEEDNVEFNVRLGNRKKSGDKGSRLDSKLL